MIIMRMYVDLLNVVSGVRHGFVDCKLCSMRGLRGIRWKCIMCHNFNLCHDCYMSNKHDMAHIFVRYDAPLSTG